jgi:hypothetical protein
VCWDFSSEFWVMFGLPILCEDYTRDVRLFLSDYSNVRLEVLT